MPCRITGQCALCEDKDARYRCPTCEVVYCTVACFKDHKEKGSCQPQANNKQHEKSSDTDMKVRPSLPQIQLTETEEEEDRIPAERLLNLENSSHLKDLLCNRHLRNMLTELDTSTKPKDLLREYMSIAIFEEFVDECLHIVEPEDVPMMQCIDADVQIIED